MVKLGHTMQDRLVTRSSSSMLDKPLVFVPQPPFTSFRRTAIVVEKYKAHQTWTSSKYTIQHRMANPPTAVIANAAATIESNAEVKAVLFDMDGVLCNSEIISRKAAAEALQELYKITVDENEFIPFTGTGEANFLGGVARKYNAPFEVESCKTKFFEIYMAKYAVPGAGIGYPGARELVQACRAAGLRTAVASSADLVKVHANLAAADISLDLFDVIVSADAFERLKPFPDIFLAAASKLGVDTNNCIVIEDAVAGVEAARAAGMRVIGVTTTLAEQAMHDASPDAILSDISKINVERIKALELREGGKDAIIAAQAKVQAQSVTTNNITTTSWLNQPVFLPAGYRTTRRDALKFLSLGAALGSGYVASTRAKSLSYASPQALLNLLFPQQTLPSTAPYNGDNERLDAFKRFIADAERRAVPIPDFPPNSDWLNVSRPLSDTDLRGRLLILDFWTYCCINCMHILPDLAYIENKYKDKPVTVIGVHSAKFDNEQDSEAIRSAVLRYDIRHPVVNDKFMVLWRSLGISSWPTLAIISPTGKLLLTLAGEGHKNDMDDILTAAIEYYTERDLLDGSKPLPMALEREKDPRIASSPLRFPGKIALDDEQHRIFISDSGNHRVVIVDSRNGKFLEAIGGNGPGLRDGPFDVTRFNRPQGLAYDSETDTLYVCDTESHAVRSVDLSKKVVRTLAGNGVKGSDYEGGRSGAMQQLNSPWDCVLVEEVIDENNRQKVLYVAMAGQHQIWKVDCLTGIASNFSGTGYERNQNGIVTSWAQPSGLALLAPYGDASQSSDAQEKQSAALLVVADSESSSIRLLDLSSKQSLPCVGGDPLFSENLFKFGDQDGVGSNALLQHPLAVAAAASPSAPSPMPTPVYVLDSYNHKLKMVDIEACSIRTIAGSGSAGLQDGRGSAVQFSEPSGIAASKDGKKVFICDTNNSVIRVYTPTNNGVPSIGDGGGNVSTLELKGVPKPTVSPDSTLSYSNDGLMDVDGGIPAGAVVVRAEKGIPGGADGVLHVMIRLPQGYHLTQGANSRFECSSKKKGKSLDDDVVTATFTPAKGPLIESKDGNMVTANIKYSEAFQSSMLRVLCTVYFCQDKSVCLFQEIVFEIPVESTAHDDGPSESDVIDLQYELSAQAPVIDFS